MNRRRLVLAILLSSAALPAPAHGQTNFKFTKVDFELLRQANQLDDYFSDSGMVFEDAATTQYVDSVGRRVLPPGDPPEHVTWKFRVLRDPLPNAFALPNGTIYIDTGLLSLMRNEAQLAGVLGHEETHVLNRHPYLEYRSVRKTTVAINIFGMVGGAVGYGGYGAAPDAIMAVSVAAPALLVASAYGYSRELEQEADMRGLAAMENAGYDPHEMAASFRLLEQSEGPDPSFSLYRDHPRLDARIQYLNEYLKKNPPAAGSALMNTGLYSESTESVCRHDIGLQIEALRPRHAVAIALHLVNLYPTSEHYFLLGESYRAMGGRPPDSSEAQLAAERKQEAKMLAKMTPQEYEKFLLTAPEGQASWVENRKEAEEAYREAIRLDDTNAKAHRGLALIYDDENNTAGAIAEYQKYLELAPTAWDRMQIQTRLDALHAPVGGAGIPGIATDKRQGAAQP